MHRIRSAPLEDQVILCGKSRIRKHAPLALDPKIVEKILENGWHSTCRGNPRVPHPPKQSQLRTVPSLVYALSDGIGIPATIGKVV